MDYFCVEMVRLSAGDPTDGEITKQSTILSINSLVIYTNNLGDALNI